MSGKAGSSPGIGVSANELFDLSGYENLTSAAPAPAPAPASSGGGQTNFQAALEELWANDPAALEQAIAQNPDAFAFRNPSAFTAENTQPQSPDFDPDAYVADMNIASLNELILYGPNLPGYGDRKAAIDAAKRRLAVINPSQPPARNGMIDQGTQTGVTPTPDYGEPQGTNNTPVPDTVIDYGPGSDNDIAPWQDPSLTGGGGGNTSVPPANGMDDDGTQLDPDTPDGGGTPPAGGSNPVGGGTPPAGGYNPVGGGEGAFGPAPGAGGGGGTPPDGAGGAGGNAGGGGGGTPPAGAFDPVGGGYGGPTPGSWGPHEDFYKHQFNRLLVQEDLGRQQAWAAAIRREAQESQPQQALDTSWGWANLPEVRTNDAAPGSGEAWSWGFNPAYNVNQGMSNQEVFQAIAGGLTPQQQSWVQQNFQQSPQGASGKFWANAGNPSAIINAVDPGAHPDWRGTVEDIANLLYTREDLTTPSGGGPAAPPPGYAAPR